MMLVMAVLIMLVFVGHWPRTFGFLLLLLPRLFAALVWRVLVIWRMLLALRKGGVSRTAIFIADG
jgi:hypothetical protein